MKTHKLQYSTTTLNNAITFIAVSGEIDLYNAQELRDHFKQLRQHGKTKFIIDFGNTQYMDSSGVGILLYMHTNAVQRNIHLRFINFTKAVHHLLKMTRIHDILPITDSLENAIEDLNRLSTQKSLSLKKLVVDEKSELFDTKNMFYKELNITLEQVRRLSLLIVQKAPPEIRELHLLEQQISELIKNAVKHGNRNDPSKKIKVWYSFTDHSAHIIVEDEGDGFYNLEEWNAFFEQRTLLHCSQEYDKLLAYLSYRTVNSDESDGGNALFAAVEYWNQGVVFTKKRNCIAVKRLIN